MTGSDTPDPDSRLVALAREVERLTRRHTDLDQRHIDLDGLVRQLAEDITLLTSTEGEHGQQQEPRSWLATTQPECSREDLTELAAWLEQVYLRYPDASLPSCWAWHPAVVEELWWLRNAHHCAYHGTGACWREIGDWHDRQRPGVVRRVHAAIGDCELARHAPDGDRAQPSPATPLAAHLAQLAEHWTTHGIPPGPTEQQLSDANQHDLAQLKVRR